MDDPAKTIAVVRGGSTTDVEQTFRTLVDRWQPTVRHRGKSWTCGPGLQRRLSAKYRDCGTVFDISGSGRRLDGVPPRRGRGAERCRGGAAGHCGRVRTCPAEQVRQARSGRGRPRGRIQGGARRSHPPGDVGVPPLWKTHGSNSSADRSSFFPLIRSRSTRGGRPLGQWHRRPCNSTVADSNAGDNIGRCGRTAQRKSPRHFRGKSEMRTSEPNPHQVNKWPVFFDSEVRKRAYRTMMQTSESGR
jgi:hypothetical protein